MAKLIKVAKMVGVMHEADHTYSIQRPCDHIDQLLMYHS